MVLELRQLSFLDSSPAVFSSVPKEQCIVSSLAVSHTYRYLEPSALRVDVRPRLVLSTTGGVGEHPYFFQGVLAQPRLVAQMLRSLMGVVQTRFHTPAAMLQRILTNADPVVTSSESRLRFEAFSACASVYARIDLDPGAAEGLRPGRGTTNVDFGPAMLACLARVRESDRLELAVGRDEVKISRDADSVVEKKVKLPVRWLKSFVEVQAHLARMELVHEVRAAEATRFLRGLPRVSTSRRSVWVVSAGRGLRISHREAGMSVPVRGLERLHALDGLAPLSQLLRIYLDPLTGASTWELQFPDSRIQLAISPEVWRGFSGEGQVLGALANEEGDPLLASVHGALRWTDSINAPDLARELDVSNSQVGAALQQLAARGIVGFDVRDGAYFHRELPYDLDKVHRLQPRLLAAERLYSEGKFELIVHSPESAEAFVQGSGTEHRVCLTPGGFTCTCPWFAKHGRGRGPCKHVLVVQLCLDRAPKQP